jgi:hypothetical protein
MYNVEDIKGRDKKVRARLGQAEGMGDALGQRQWQLARGDKALIGNSAYRRYLRRTPSASGKPSPAFEIDAGKLAEEARYDGRGRPSRRLSSELQASFGHIFYN